MGNTLSARARRYQLLIGSYPDDMPTEETKLFNLSHIVFNKDDTDIGKISEILNFRILDKMVLTSLDNTHEQGETETDAQINQNNTGIESVEIGDTETCDSMTDRDFTLFMVLISDKPFYFSQTFSQWLTMYRYANLIPPSCCPAEKRKIYIQPVDSFPSFITEQEFDIENTSCNFFYLLKKFMEAYFDEMIIDILPNVNILEAKWNIRTRAHHKTGSKQYYVQDFFPKLRKVLPRDGFCIMGISWTDLYPTEKLNFVLGEAHFISKSGIFCFGRCEPKTFDAETHKDITEIDAKILWRMLKVMSHETCHLFGLQHCWYFHCSMNESNSMAEAASQPLFLCPVCLRKLQHVCGFRIGQRYRRLLCLLRVICRTFPSEEFKNSVKWLENCLAYLESEE